jgi:hypothetical protein
MAEMLALFDRVRADQAAGQCYDAARRRALFWDFLAIALDHPAGERVFYDRDVGPNHPAFLRMIFGAIESDVGPEMMATVLGDFHAPPAG